ncbi:DUF309 domain-containing protein [Paenibacillus sp. y28]|uniref:DUF309 domain-containing protein n=1 Tax=Paenibacillus sp. y28 TaxID=3129110 RepID=UPI00301668CC
MTQIHYPAEYITFLAHFHGDRDLFECHEVLEEYWKEEPDHPYREAWLGFIQVAVGLYHQRRGNDAGAEKMLAAAVRHLHVEQLEQLGVDSSALHAGLQDRLIQVKCSRGTGEKAAYSDFDIPIRDPELLKLAQARCESLGVSWGAPSRMNDPQVVHRHTLRDRTEVIEERRKQLDKRRLERGEA